MSVRIIVGDARQKLRDIPDNSVHMAVTSPPYWSLRDYGTGKWVGGDPECEHKPQRGLQGGEGQRASRSFTGEKPQMQACRRCGAVRVDEQVGLEETPEAFVAELVGIFEEVRRILRPDGTLWLNLGDSYAGSGRGGNPTEVTSTLEGGQESQRAAIVRRGRGSKEIGATARDAAVTNIGRRATSAPTRFSPDADEDGRIHTSGVRPPPGLKQKDLIGIPWMVAFALRAAGWWLRQDIVWAKPNPMPESVRDRCTKAHEYIFLLTKTDRYYYDADAIAEDAVSDHPSGNGYKRDARLSYQNADGSARGNDEQWNGIGGRRNRRSVWSITTQPFPEAHFATFPPNLVQPCIAAGTSERGCCTSCGAGWVRITRRIQSNQSNAARAGTTIVGKDHPTSQVRDGHDIRNGPVTAAVTLGWYPGCDCDDLLVLPAYPTRPQEDEAIPAWKATCALVDEERKKLCDSASAIKTSPSVVLDPFGGAGTVGLVADRMQRDAIMIELNPKYAGMAEARLRKEAGLMADIKVTV